jgi:hypothetical protein
MNKLLKDLILEIILSEGNKLPKWLRNGEGKTKQVMTKHLSKVKK